MSDITWSFAGKVALVSGGASGIGRAAAAAWVAAGARVAVFDQSAERLEETAGALGREALATVAGDVSDEGDCERAVAETLARFARLDILLNSAGTGAMGRVWDLEPLVWDRVLAVNLRGTFLLARGEPVDGRAEAPGAHHQHSLHERDRAERRALALLR